MTLPVGDAFRAPVKATSTHLLVVLSLVSLAQNHLKTTREWRGSPSRGYGTQEGCVHQSKVGLLDPVTYDTLFYSRKCTRVAHDIPPTLFSPQHLTGNVDDSSQQGPRLDDLETGTRGPAW